MNIKEINKKVLNVALSHINILPEKAQEPFRLYIEKGIIPKSPFLQAILANSFVDILGYRNKETLDTLYKYGNFMLNYMPSSSWGSYEILEEWAKYKKEGNR